MSIEPNQNIEAEEADEDQTMIDEDFKSLTTEPVVPKRLTPILQKEKGYFTIGPEKEATNMFLFNVFICFGNYVQQAFPKDLKVQENDTCQFVYDLFGTQITSKPFQWCKMSDFKPERATAKIFTTPEKLIRFFQEKMETFCIFVCNDSIHLSIGQVSH